MSKFKVGDIVRVKEYLDESSVSDVYAWMRGREAAIIRVFDDLYECVSVNQSDNSIDYLFYDYELEIINGNESLLETIAAKDARIAELENQILEVPANRITLASLHNEILKKRITELEAQLAELTAPKPVVCDNCNSKIEGEIYLRYMAHDTISLCGACVTENED